MNDSLYSLKESLVKELEAYGKSGDLSKSSIEMIDKLAHATKNIAKVIECCESDEGYSRMGGHSYRDASTDYVRPDGSYRGARRDSMGRYSRHGEGMDERTKERLREMIENL